MVKLRDLNDEQKETLFRQVTEMARRFSIESWNHYSAPGKDRMVQDEFDNRNEFSMMVITTQIMTLIGNMRERTTYDDLMATGYIMDWICKQLAAEIKHQRGRGTCPNIPDYALNKLRTAFDMENFIQKD